MSSQTETIESVVLFGLGVKFFIYISCCRKSRSPRREGGEERKDRGEVKTTMKMAMILKVKENRSTMTGFSSIKEES